MITAVLSCARRPSQDKMNVRILALLATYLVLVLSTAVVGLWWARRGPLVLDPTAICRRTRRLVGRQRQICREEKEIVREASKGAGLALDECKQQFASRRWNCSTARRSFRKILRRDTRETAFVYAITAAGVVYAVTQACSMGNLIQCSCDHSVRSLATDGKFEWGGCADNVNFGYKKSREFMDARPKRKRFDITTKIRLHNNEAGRKALTKFMELKCKCHGLSGSCALRTCWRKMPQFGDSGKRLKGQFDGAVKVTVSNDGSKLITDGDKTIKKFNSMSLIYSEDSPNFCRRSKKQGTIGTRGRVCIPDSIEVGGCDLLCCHRGFIQKEITEKENCKCRFIWCCQVKCQTCMSLKTISYCS